jgi:hypothetical protein
MPYIDISECLRVFPDLFKMTNEAKVVDNQTEPKTDNQIDTGFLELSEKNRLMEHDLQSLKERLQIETSRREAAEERELWLRNHVDKITNENTLLLAAPKSQKSGILARFFGR